MATIENLLSKMVDKINNSVKTEIQDFNTEQQQTIRNNISAASLDDVDEIATYIMAKEVQQNLIPVLNWDGQIDNRPIYAYDDYRMVLVSNEVIYNTTKDDLIFLLNGAEALGAAPVTAMQAYPWQSDNNCMWLVWDGDVPLFPLMMCIYEDSYQNNVYTQKGTYLLSYPVPINLGNLDSSFAGVESFIQGFYVSGVFSGDYSIPAINNVANSITYTKYPFTINKNVLTWDGETVLSRFPYNKNNIDYKHIYNDSNRALDLFEHNSWATFIMENGNVVVEDYSSLDESQYLILLTDEKNNYPCLPGLYIHPDVRKVIMAINIEPFLYNQIDSNYYNDIEKYMNDERELILSTSINITYPSEEADDVTWDEATSKVFNGNIFQLEENKMYTVAMDGVEQSFKAKNYNNEFIYIGNIDAFLIPAKECWTTGFPAVFCYNETENISILIWSRDLSSGKHSGSIYKGAKQLQTTYIPIEKLIDENIDYIYEKILERTEQLKNS